MKDRKNKFFRETLELMQSMDSEHTETIEGLFGVLLYSMKTNLVAGHPVVLPGIGTLEPVIKENGRVTIEFTPNKKFLLSINSYDND